MIHANSFAAYKTLNLTASQMRVARAILNETRRERPASIDSLFLKYGIMPNVSSPRIGELKKMAEACEAFTLDGEEYALVCVGKVETSSKKQADAFKLEKFAVVRAAWLERNKGVGEQVKLQF